MRCCEWKGGKNNASDTACATHTQKNPAQCHFGHPVITPTEIKNARKGDVTKWSDTANKQVVPWNCQSYNVTVGKIIYACTVRACTKLTPSKKCASLNNMHFKQHIGYLIWWLWSSVETLNLFVLIQGHLKVISTLLLLFLVPYKTERIENWMDMPCDFHKNLSATVWDVSVRVLRLSVPTRSTSEGIDGFMHFSSESVCPVWRVINQLPC